MTHISPRHARDLADRFARMHRAEDIRQIRHTIVELAFAMGLVILAAFAGYMAHGPTCASAAAQWTVDTN